MPKNVSSQDKLLAVDEYLTGKGSLESIAKKYNAAIKLYPHG